MRTLLTDPIQPNLSHYLRTPSLVITEAETQGLLKPGSHIFEGTSGSTGISIAMVAKAKWVVRLNLEPYLTPVLQRLQSE